MGSGSEHRKGAAGSSKGHHRGFPRRCRARLRPHARAGERNHVGAAITSLLRPPWPAALLLSPQWRSGRERWERREGKVTEKERRKGNRWLELRRGCDLTATGDRRRCSQCRGCASEKGGEEERKQMKLGLQGAAAWSFDVPRLAPSRRIRSNA
jgi:hypothetical protein